MEPAPRRRSRLRLYLPFLLLLLVASGWSVAWFVLRGRAVDGLDAWLAAEAAQGKTWTCRDRTTGGFPFRIELRCADLAFARADATASLGRVLVVSQVYRPGHVIAELSGPLSARSTDGEVSGQWGLVQASLVFEGAGLGRFALVADAPTFRVASRSAGTIEAAAKRFEVHLRPDPATAGAYDVALSATALATPLLDALAGSSEPADVESVATVTEARSLPVRPDPAELERWRLAGGRLAFTRLSLAKGPVRVAGTGGLALDDAHRPAGEFQLAAAGLEAPVSRLLGERAGLAVGLVGALLSGGRKAAAAPDLRPLPPIALAGGRVRFGPLTVPGLRLDPLY